METRVSQFIRNQSEQEIYSDFHNSFVAHPISGKIKKLTNQDAVVQSVKNRIKTMFGERLYNSNIGSSIYFSLFEPNDSFLIESLEKKIENSLQHDKRIEIKSIDIKVQEVEINITMSILIKNNANPITFSIMLRKVR